MVTGASGLLGHHVCRYLVAQDEQVVGLHNHHAVDVDGVGPLCLDLLDEEKLRRVIEQEKPDYIFHTAALANVDQCQKSPQDAYRYNADIPHALAKLAQGIGSKMIHVTTDQLWPGDKANVTEEEPTAPVNIYGETKALSERLVLEQAPASIILRTNFFGEGRPWRMSFSDWLFHELSNNKSIQGFDDIFYTPIALDYLVPYAIDLAKKEAHGIFHLAGAERVSKFEFIKKFIGIFGLDASLVKQCACHEANLQAPRPKDMSLSVKKVEGVLGRSMPSVEESILTLKKL